jgi:spore coat polysaccharide biosynthesis predicted glycosyltransferase SpsG
MPDNADAEVGALRLKWKNGVDLLVVDHYERGAQFVAALGGWASRILTFDDWGSKPKWAGIAVDIVPPENGISAIERHADRLYLRGAIWAQLDPRLHVLRTSIIAKDDQARINRILIAIGATDAGDVTSKVLEALQFMNFSGTTDVALTAAAPHLPRVREKVANVPFTCTLHIDTVDMPSLLATADLVVGACGTSSWERACLGKPSVALVVADNQLRNAAALKRFGAAIVAGTDVKIETAAIVESLNLIQSDPDKRRHMAQQAMILTDGLGAFRLGLVIDPPRNKMAEPVYLFPAQASDAKAIFAWQTEPGARRFSRNPAAPTWDEHCAWLTKKLGDPNCVFNLILVDAQVAGFVRLDALDRDTFEVSILISEAFQGCGVAQAALAGVRRLLPDAEFIAEILPGNDASSALFKRAGYVPENGRLVHHAAQRNAA